MMLQHLGEPEAANAIMAAIETVLSRGGAALTPDLGGVATTESTGIAIANEIHS